MMSFAAGCIFMEARARWLGYLNGRREDHARRVLGKAVRWIFERRPLKIAEEDALLLEAASCGCPLDDLMERRLSLYMAGRRFPAGEPYHLAGLRVAYLYPYLAKDRQLLPEDKDGAGLVYRFKAGEYDEDLLAAFCRMFGRMGLDKGRYVLLCLPASSRMRTEERYRRFSHDLSVRMGWQDGYGALMPVPHEPFHLGGRRKMLTGKDFVLDKHLLKGRKIVMLDDLLTTGLTVLSVRRLLEKEGLRPVAAVFVARTVE